MKKLICSIMLLMATVNVYYGCDSKGEQVKTVVVRDTVYKDSFVVTVHDTVYYEAKWLRKKFETAGWAYWKNYGDGYEVEYPDFMNKVELYQGERNLRVEYHDISMVVSAYNDKHEMTVREKYEGQNMSAVTKSMTDSSFLLAGNCGKDRLYFEIAARSAYLVLAVASFLATLGFWGKDRLYFEKDIKLKSHTWLYLRVEFPSELTWAVDPLLQYVKGYRP